MASSGAAFGRPELRPPCASASPDKAHSASKPNAPQNLRMRHLQDEQFAARTMQPLHRVGGERPGSGRVALSRFLVLPAAEGSKQRAWRGGGWLADPAVAYPKARK